MLDGGEQHARGLALREASAIDVVAAGGFEPERVARVGRGPRRVSDEAVGRWSGRRAVTL